MKKHISLIFIIFLTSIKPTFSAELKFSMICPYDGPWSSDLIIDTTTNKITKFSSYSLVKLGIGQWKIDPEQTMIEKKFISIIGIHSMYNEYFYAWYDFENLLWLSSNQDGSQTEKYDCEKKLQL